VSPVGVGGSRRGAAGEAEQRTSFEQAALPSVERLGRRRLRIVPDPTPKTPQDFFQFVCNSSAAVYDARHKVWWTRR
jgi:hypothetical protein